MANAFPYVLDQHRRGEHAGRKRWYGCDLCEAELNLLAVPIHPFIPEEGSHDSATPAVRAGRPQR